MSKSKRKKRMQQVPGETVTAVELQIQDLETNIIEIDFKNEQKSPEMTAQPEIEEEATLPEIEEEEPTLPGLEELAASKAWRLALEPEEVNSMMERGVFGALKLVPWGSNYTFLSSLCDEQGGSEYAIIYKPRRGEAPLWDFPNGTLYRREYAAYLVSAALNWHFIPPVIIRDGPHGPGTTQIFVDANENIQYYQFRDEHEHELKRIAIFDLITNNADRKASHCLLGADGYIWAIDHGLCFNTVPKLRTIIWEFSGEPIPEDIHQDLLELITNPVRRDALHAQLLELLDKREVEIFFRRLEQMAESSTFPGLSSRRQIPWGM